jgi:hypothetical protein
VLRKATSSQKSEKVDAQRARPPLPPFDAVFNLSYAWMEI